MCFVVLYMYDVDVPMLQPSQYDRHEAEIESEKHKRMARYFYQNVRLFHPNSNGKNRTAKPNAVKRRISYSTLLLPTRSSIAKKVTARR